MRIAVIDIGSNAIRTEVVEADAVGNQRVLARETTLMPFARGVARTGEIAPQAFQEGLEALALTAQVIQGFRCDTVMACGTEALRTASNAPLFIQETARMGINIRVISRDNEARLLFQTAKRAVPISDKPMVLLNLGESNTRLTWIQGEMAVANTTLPWGFQSLADNMPTADPPTPEDLKHLNKFLRKGIKKACKGLPEGLPKAEIILGTSETLRELALGCGGDPAFTRKQLLHFKRDLWRVGAQGRIHGHGVSPSQAEVSHVAASLILGIMNWLDIQEGQCLPVGLREGLLWEVLELGGQEKPGLPECRMASVEALAADQDPDPAHSRQVMRLADLLFLDLLPILGLGDLEQELLRHAARLHDIGLSSADKEHHKHGACLIQNAHLAGFGQAEATILAQVVRFHRGKDPDPLRHEGFAQLEPWHRSMVEKLTAILRVADALDRRRRQSIQTVRIRLDGDEALFVIQGSGDLRPELERLQEKGLMLFRLLDRPVRTVVNEAPRER